MKEQDLTRSMHSRATFAATAAVTAVCTAVAWMTGAVINPPGNNGLGLVSPDRWLDRWPAVNLAAGIGANILIALALLYINRRFNVLRSVSSLFASFFLMLQCALPPLAGRFYDGTLLALTVAAAVVPLYSAFQRPTHTRAVFTIFALLSCGVLTDYSYLVYVVAFLVGCVQMQCLSLKGILAVGLGLATPPWILWGLGLADPATLEMPRMVSVFADLRGHERIMVMAYLAVTLLLGLGATAVNMVKTYNYNARARAYNGFWVILMLATLALMAVDYYHLLNYMPVLNLCVAVEAGQLFTRYNTRRSYFPGLCLALLYTSFYLWSVLT